MNTACLRAVGAPVGLLALLAALSACSPDIAPRDRGRATVLAPLSVPADSLRVQTGRGWEHPRSSIPVGRDGRFDLSVQVRLATVFADLNGNGRLDRFAEPSAPCTLTDGDWSCRLSSTRLFVHRLIRTDSAGALQDRTLFVAEAYDERTGQPAFDARLCDTRGTCAVAQTGPYANVEPGLMLGLCDLDAGTADNVDVTFSRPGAPLRQFSIRQPPAVRVRATLRRLPAGDLEVVAATDAPIDRAVVWLGTFDENSLVQLAWSSEQPNARLQLAKHSTAVTVPAAAVRRCLHGPGVCRAAVQTAATVPGTVVPTFTQAETFIEVPL